MGGPPESPAGFRVYSSGISAEILRGWYSALEGLSDRGRVAHYDSPPEIVEALRGNPVIRQAVREVLGSGASFVHSAFHNNAHGAEPLGWHSDDCKPWHQGDVASAPPAVRIWF